MVEGDSGPAASGTQSIASAVEHAVTKSQELFEQFAARSQELTGIVDPLGIGASFQRFALQLARNPLPLWETQWRIWIDGLSVLQQSFIPSEDAKAGRAQTSEDRRFRDREWTSNPLFDFIRHTYLILANSLIQLTSHADGLEPKDAQKVAFYTRQFVDAISPSNFALTNPEVVRATLERGGANLVEGLRNFLDDIDLASGQLRTKMVDSSAFELGRNIATSPGSVVFQNDLMQLIQYAPTTERVYRRPLLIIPPWINKYYVLDLKPENSFIRWAVSEGHTVFVISWVNPDAKLREKDFADYLKEGPLVAMDAMEAATGERSFNLIGYCLGGTLLGAMLAYLRQKQDERINATTFFTAMLDFSDPGELGVFIDEKQVCQLEKEMETRGYLDGKEMAATFNLMRASDLIWSFVINNYLLGKTPAPFDLLYWNSDSTRMPARMHSTYLRKMYMQNLLCKPGQFRIDDVSLDLSRVSVPCCFVSALEDHIAPWKSTFEGAKLFGGPVEFILGKAGHIAGIINPPGPKAYGHYTGPEPAGEADDWLHAATFHQGSWWLTWAKWIEPHGGGRVQARKPGDRALPRLEAAPGSYAKVRLV